MLRKLSPLALLPLLIAATPLVDWPDTPAGHAARDYFAAYDAGSEAAMRDYDARYRPSRIDAREMERVEKARAVRSALGAVEPVRVESASPDVVTVIAKNGDGAELSFAFTMSPTDPSKVRRIELAAPDGDDARPRKRS